MSTKTVRQKIYEKIRDDVTFGHLAPGERLTEKKLLDIYKVSRTPIREALGQLEAEGLIIFETNKGYEVPKLSNKQICDIYDIRELLEGYAVRASIEKMSNKEIEGLESLHKNLIKAAHNNDVRMWLQNNALFHGFFRDRSDNEYARQLSIMLKRRIFQYQSISFQEGTYYDLYIKDHAAIIEACKKKNAILGEKLMRSHMVKIKDILIKGMSPNQNHMLDFNLAM